MPFSNLPQLPLPVLLSHVPGSESTGTHEYSEFKLRASDPDSVYDSHAGWEPAAVGSGIGPVPPASTPGRASACR